ncbi:MAG: hypothetical protein A3F82_10110 [Deltaproteobacteria bacterium RIFCSPLOWO2_12_FULL_44_12]|nr:MAG: hypothetical protein A2712_00220 [Deltaproteobacteria bacterium RIFCSPHIGHO2_01_FULL_43_49]OGQ15842.1 MAG: hypothetical protein A3D22_02870 [Deltaproteobacteria bacterium RIFCSPHIGHO2_02_FULL_44_53]OGQ28796.1 MAG: hypothetical protein A3D98_01200 [Deltaproteobacteria bacterium RIFCSPHIGHO2_12_FULL_44_21]OGQ32116.1 MAG: hypothetical protein A2979_03325 [Deltaproteobacteria bacterium RIFCSPLOWO2_01_FULL_45_74]OGQ43741.1 MAG: hypothetical protein A3I70_05665 [Deltaproteobacteria bacterium 
MKIAYRVSGSKSITHRALFCAALARGKNILINPLVCDDTFASVNVLRRLGMRISMETSQWIVEGSPLQNPKEPLDCNESGTTFRFITALTDAFKIPCEITGKPSLIQRGATPPSNISSQYISGMLLAKPQSKKEVEVSKPYVELTLAVQKAFGVDVEAGHLTYQPTIFTIEGDWSSAAFLLAANFLTGKEIKIEGLNPNSLQPDREIVSILNAMKSRQAIEWDLTNCPDLYPIVAVLCSTLKGKSVLKGIERLKYKESDRSKEMERVLKTNVVDSKDHRIIMAAAVLGLVAEEKMIFKNPECVKKSFPDFWNALKLYQ